MDGSSNTERYAELINSTILPFIDYDKLQNSYDTDMSYAKGVLNRLHEAMVTVYGGGQLYDVDGGDGFVLIPGAVRGKENGNLCIALLELDLSSSGEHWGTTFLCKHGVIPQSVTADADNELRRQSKEIGKLIGSYDYGYTAEIPDDIHVDANRLPDELRIVLMTLRIIALYCLMSGNRSLSRPQLPKLSLPRG